VSFYDDVPESVVNKRSDARHSAGLDALFNLARYSTGAMVPGTWTPGSRPSYAENHRRHKQPEQHTARFVICGAIGSGIVLAGLVMLVAFVRGLLTFPPHLSVVLGFLIAAAITGVVTGCVLYRARTRYWRIMTYVRWGGFMESYPDCGSKEQRHSPASAVSTTSGEPGVDYQRWHQPSGVPVKVRRHRADGRGGAHRGDRQPHSARGTYRRRGERHRATERLGVGPPSLPSSRSGTFRGRIVISLIILVVVTALTITTFLSWHGLLNNPMVLSYWLLGNGALLFCMFAFLKGRRFNDQMIAAGRVAAIVPAYDEDPEELNNVVYSILEQSIPVNVIYVVDDGSKVPVGQPFHHPKVIWMRKENGGKRSAQVYALTHMDPDAWDFILTVDGDSILDPYALEHQLRAFSTNSVMATTGMVLVRNRRDNLLTRLADMNIGTSCVMMRASRSLLGTLETTSGALAVYRAHILFKHTERYLNGSYGDDRALAMYSALEGEVVGVNEAVVWSAMPTTTKATYKQRLRWSKSWWCMIPFVLTNMMRFRQMFFPLFGLMQLAIAPLTIAYIFIYSLYEVAHAAYHPETLLLYGTLYLVVRYAMTALYMVERPGMRLHQRLLTWFFITPLEAIYNLVFLNPTKYIALVKLRDHHWGTRGTAVHVSRAKRFLFAVGVTLSISAIAAAIGGAMWAGGLPLSLPPPPNNLPVLNNNVSTGKVVFTFDDGPGIHSLELISELKAEHVPAIFFEIGDKVAADPRVVRAEVKAGFLVEVHTWDHKSLTGASTHTKPLTDAQVRSELVKCINAIVAAGAPRPTLWRPPYGDVNARDAAIASSLGLRLVMSWSVNRTITDNGDWQGISSTRIIHNVTSGWGQEVRIHGGSIIAGHDGIDLDAPNTIAAMPGIVRYMNMHHLGTTDKVPADATGGDLNPPSGTAKNSGTG
jgi:cellulose synthase/poly-beta-1,6-N-acetylglucosamine synthase-like glycosyltransferase/peptidoglycan/xylan/chitin deacetylase (PgdA/CDA1 family)